MKRSRFLLNIVAVVSLLALLAVPLVSSLAAPAAHGQPPKEIVGYFIEWGVYGRSYYVNNIVTSGAADKLTVINYAFANAAPNASGQVVCQLFDPWADWQIPHGIAGWPPSVDGQEHGWGEAFNGNFLQLKLLKQRYPQLKVLISLGGWTGSKWFSDAALTSESREAFVASCIDMFIRGNIGGLPEGAAAGVFDGIDIDWEYPAAPGNPGNVFRPEDTQNFTKLLAEFRKQLDRIDKDLMLTIAAPAGESRYSKIELREIHRYLDFINLMTYDFHGTWEMNTNHQANLFTSSQDPNPPESRFSVNDTVLAYRRSGVPGRKLVVGLPFYGHGWTGVTNANNGLYQTATSAAPGVWEAGVNDYKALKDLTSSGFTRYWDRRAQDAWLFDGTTFWTFDDPQSVCVKMAYTRLTGLRGAMFWELSGDDATGTLISAIDTGLNDRLGHCP